MIEYFRRVSLAMAIALTILWPLAAYAQGISTALISHVDVSQLPDLRVFVSALDSAGRPIPRLEKGNVRVLEDGVPLDIVEVVPAVESMTIVLALDTSGSMAEGQAGNLPIDHARRAAMAFVEHVKSNTSASAPPDQLAIVGFNDKPAIISGLSTDHNAAINTLGKLKAEQKWTALYDAAYDAIKLAAGVPQGRRAVLLFTDGKDEGAGGKPGSSMKFDDVVELSRRGAVPLYVVGLGNQIEAQELERLAKLTGGLFFKETDAARLTPLFERIASQLKTQHRVVVRSGGAATDHTIQVQITRDGAQAADTRTVHYGAIPPVVRIVAPAEGAPVQGEVELLPGFSAYLQRPIVKVEFWDGTQLLGTSTTPPFALRWDSATAKSGAHEIEARATDSAGLVGTHKIPVTVLPVTPTPVPPPPPPPPPVKAPAPPTTAPAAPPTVTPVPDFLTRLSRGDPQALAPAALVVVLAVGLAGAGVVFSRSRAPVVPVLTESAGLKPPTDPGGTTPVTTPIGSSSPTEPMGQAALATLKVIRGPAHVGQTFDVGERTIIGREAGSCDIAIDDPSTQVSRVHAQIYREGDEFFIRDLNSTNGTRVNGKPVRAESAAPLPDGAEITLANRYVLKLQREPGDSTGGADGKDPE